MNLKKLRLLNDYSQQDIAKKLNITQATYCNYEKEKTQPELQTLIFLANFFNVSLDYLTGRDFKNSIEIGSLTEKKKELLKLVLNLEEKHCERVIGLIYAYVDQYNQNYKQINNKPNWN